MSTAVLRAGLVIGAIVLGIFVLSKAFPSAEDTPPVSEEAAAPEETDTEEQTPGQDGQGGGGNDGGGGGNQPDQQETPDVSNVEVSVLNGAGITDLADCVSREVVAELGFQVGEVANAESEYETTTIFFTRDLRDAAEYLKAQGLPRAELQPAARGASFADLVVNLGQDAATGPCENPS